MYKKKLTDKDEREVLSAYERGELIKSIAARFSISESTVMRTVKRLGGKLRPQGFQRDHPDFIPPERRTKAKQIQAKRIAYFEMLKKEKWKEMYDR